MEPLTWENVSRAIRGLHGWDSLRALEKFGVGIELWSRYHKDFPDAWYGEYDRLVEEGADARVLTRMGEQVPESEMVWRYGYRLELGLPASGMDGKVERIPYTKKGYSDSRSAGLDDYRTLEAAVEAAMKDLRRALEGQGDPSAVLAEGVVT